MRVKAFQRLPAAELMFSALASGLTVYNVDVWRSERLQVVERRFDLWLQLDFVLQKRFLAWLRYRLLLGLWLLHWVNNRNDNVIFFFKFLDFLLNLFNILIRGLNDKKLFAIFLCVRKQILIYVETCWDLEITWASVQPGKCVIIFLLLAGLFFTEKKILRPVTRTV